MTMASVSIVIPTYNRAGLLPAAIASVQAQTYAAWELIVVDDGSNDATPEEVAALAGADPRIRLVANTGRHGSARCAQRRACPMPDPLGCLPRQRR